MSTATSQVNILLLLAATTWLWGRSDRHNPPPASYVMNLIFRRSDDSRVSVDTVYPSLQRYSSFSSPRWYHLQSISPDVLLVSPPYVAKPPQSCLPVSLGDVLCLQCLPDVIVSNMVSQCAHLPIFIYVTSIYFTRDLVTGTVFVPYSIAG